MKAFAAILALVFLVFLAGGALAADPAGTVILDEKSHWQVERTWVPGLVQMEDGRLVPLMPGAGLKGPSHNLSFAPDPTLKYDLPHWPQLPDNWAAPEFNDSGWNLNRGAVTNNDYYIMRARFTPGWDFSLARMRGRFLVTDPAAVKELTLDVCYQGGLVVYLNGAEVARGNLPEGAISPSTAAANYTAEDGQRKTEWERCDKMDRRLTGVKLPAAKLLRGVNVLAIEAHRSPIPEKMIRSSNNWLPLEVCSIRLSATSPAGLVPNAGKLAGLHLWACEPAQRVQVDDLGDSSRDAGAIRIVACRNGSFSGQTVIYNDKPLGQVNGAVGELRTADGAAALPAGACLVRYARPDLDISFDGLEEIPPATVPLRFIQRRPHEPKQEFLAIQPVWVTVRVPADAKPGEYKGILQLNIAGQSSVKAPLEVKVHDFAMPATRDFATFLEMQLSPDTLAQYYKVPMWSQEHWKLIERSFELTAQAGSKLVFIPLFARARFGNDNGMLYFIRKGDGWDYDFSVIDRYLDLAQKYLDRNMVVIWHVTEPAHDDKYWSIRWHGSMEPQKHPQVTVRDPNDGSLSLFKAPLFGTPEARVFWKPVFDRIQDMVQKRGLSKRALTLGTEQDLGVSNAFFEDMKAFAPGFKWSRCMHPAPPESLKYGNGIELGYTSDVYGGVMHHTPDQQRDYGWKWRDDETLGVHAHWPRQVMPETAPLGMIEHVMEMHIISSPFGTKKYAYAGLSYQGAEFWVIPGVASKSSNGTEGTLIDRFPESIWGSISISNGTRYWLAPGPNGAISTARFEVLREGIEDANVRVFLERVLTNPARRASLGEDLANKAQALLDERAIMIASGEHRSCWQELDSGVGTRREKLLSMAAIVAGAIKP